MTMAKGGGEWEKGTSGPVMSRAAFTERFFELEENSDLFGFRVRNQAIWDYLRYPIFRVLLDLLVQRNEINYRSTKKPRYARELRHMVPVALRCLWHRVSAKKYDLIFVNYERKQDIAGKKGNVHFLPLASALRHRYRILLLDPSTYDEPVESVYPCDVFRSRVLHHRASLGAYLVRYTEKEQEIVSQIHDILIEAFDVRLDMKTLVRTAFSYQLRLFEEYKKLFAWTRPSVALCCDTGSYKGWMAAARELGITVVDYQHAVMSQQHILYKYPKIKTVDDIRTRPNYIFTFGEFWHDHYQVATKLIPVGFPYQEAKIRAVRSKKQKQTERMVVISSIHSGKTLESLALGLSELLPELEIIYKLRPEERDGWRNVYTAELASRQNIRVADSGEPDLYELFATSKYQLGINSTAVVEGLAFGLTTFIVKVGWYTDMASLIEKELVFLVSEAGEIAEKIISGEQPRCRPVVEEMFKPESVQNLHKALETVTGFGQRDGTGSMNIRA